MELFFYNSVDINPVQMVICKVDNEETFELIQSLSHNIFNVLFTNGLSNTHNLLVLSIIKDHTQTISNLITPSIHTNKELVTYFTNNTEHTNILIKNVLENCDTSCSINLEEDDITISHKNYNLSSLSDFYNN